VRTVKPMENGLKRSHEIRRPYRETKRPRRVCAVHGSCLVQRLRSFIDSLFKAVPRWYTRAYRFPCVQYHESDTSATLSSPSVPLLYRAVYSILEYVLRCPLVSNATLSCWNPIYPHSSMLCHLKRLIRFININL